MLQQGGYLRRGRASTVEHKPGSDRFDPVTEADRQAERVLRTMIHERYPDHGVLGEEFGLTQEQAAWRWVLDPIDGTRSFISGVPLWGTLIALCYNGEPVLGCADHPALSERYLAAGAQAQRISRDGRQTLRTRHCASLSHATLLCTDPAVFAAGLERTSYERLYAQVRLVRHGTDCFGYCLLAGGQVDVVLEAGLEIYDVAALVPIVPTTLRVFDSRDRVTSFVRAYQGGKKSLVSATLTVRIVDSGGKDVFHATESLGAERFAAARGADVLRELPLGDCAPGPHLLTFEVRLGNGGASARRDVRFSVR